MTRIPRSLWILALALALVAGGCATKDVNEPDPDLVVNSFEDIAAPAAGTITLRSALEAAGDGEIISFDASLDGGTILLTIVGEEHSVLKGEVYVNNVYSGYTDRDYGKSALYARKTVVIDASDLPHGITVRWGGGEASHARVMAVYGNLTMSNVTIADGYSLAEAIAGGTQPYTLARGGGLAVWGMARLHDCVVTGNTCVGDTAASRDRGTYGGGIYSDGLDLEDTVVSGNRALGAGAGGGGIYSVGGADNGYGRGNDTALTRCTISGNRVTAQHAYGGGIFTLSGGPDNLARMTLTNCTVARNVVEDNPDIPNAGQFYYRGAGIYMGGGSLSVKACTIAENATTGQPAVFSGKPNMAGGVAATIGNAHTVEYVDVQHSIVVGNTLNGEPDDWFAGSILFFDSGGYNVIGKLNVSQILVPVPDWMMSSRKRWPKTGDVEGATIEQVLDVAGAQYHATALSAGTDAGGPAILWYPPADLAVDKIAAQSYSLTYVNAGYSGFGVPSDDFLNHVILKCRSLYGSILGADFGSEFGDLTGTTWYGPAVTWPTNPENAAWVAFWRNLDIAIGDRLGQAVLADDFWGSFTTGPVGDHCTIIVTRTSDTFWRESQDQVKAARPNGAAGDIGAIER
jgi:hypothetical protein